MSFGKASEFKIEILIKEIVFDGVQEGGSEEAVGLELKILKTSLKAEQEPENFIPFTNGCHGVALRFKLVNEPSEEESNEDFTFRCLGDPVTVKLMKAPKTNLDSRKTSKKPKNGKEPTLPIATGSINLLHNLQRFQSDGSSDFHITMNTTEGESFEVYLQYRICFANPPRIDRTLAVDAVLVGPPTDAEIVLHFPNGDSKFNTARLYAAEVDTLNNREALLVHEILKAENFQLGTDLPAHRFVYENFQSADSFDFLTELVGSDGNLLMELKCDNQVFMAFISLRMFGYEGVDHAKFLLPLYIRNQKAILEMFRQDLSAFLVEEKSEKGKRTKGSAKQMKEEETGELLPWMVDDVPVAVMVNLKVTKPVVSEVSIDELKAILNQHITFIEEVTKKQNVVAECEKNFSDAIKGIAEKMEKFIDENPQLEAYNTEQKLKNMIEKGELYDKEQFKSAVKDLIGNKLNVDKKTETNHEFKLTMIDSFKTLSFEVTNILYDRKIEELSEPLQAMSRKLRKTQTEEWIAMKQVGKAHKIYVNELQEGQVDAIWLMDYIIFLLRTGQFIECEKQVIAFLKKDHLSTFGFYILSYLMLTKGNLEVAVMAMEVAVKIHSENMELWIILMMLYVKAEYRCGADFCDIKLQESKFVSDDADDFELMLHQDLKSEDDLAKIINQQMKLGLIHFADLTRGFMSTTSRMFKSPTDEIYLRMIDHVAKQQLKDAMNLMTELEMTDDNEIMARIFKGNLLHESGGVWKEICEYEIAYNLSLKAGEKFPHLLTMRCANWYLIESKNLQKARRYFNHCCKSSPTFNSWMGLGIVCYKEMNYQDAEKYLQEANKIDNSSGDNWIYLALTNFRLEEMAKFEKCFLIARKLSTENLKLIEEAEKLLNI